MKSLEDVFNAASLCNFADKKTGDPVIVYASDIENMRKKYNTLHCGWQFIQSKIDVGEIWPFRKVHNEIKSSLAGAFIALFPDKLVLAGGAICSLLVAMVPRDYDIFFYNTTPAEAEKIIIECAKYLEQERADIIIYERSQYVTNINVGNEKIQFVHRIYETRGQILLGFDLTGSRIGWAADCGIFATVDGAVAIACHGFPLDLTQLSTSFGSRLLKYIYEKRFIIFFPNMRYMDGDTTITTPDFTIYRQSYRENRRVDISRKRKTNIRSEDYEDCGNSYKNWWHIARDSGEFVIFESGNIEKMSNIDRKIAKESVICGTIWDGVFVDCNYTATKIKTAKWYLGDDFYKFMDALAAENGILATEIWRARKQHYTNIAITLAKKASSLDKWRTKDPGSQSFGKYNPVNVSPREWFGDANYVPYVVGLAHDRVITFRLCCGRIYSNLLFDMPNEVENLIIKWWFWAEVNDARNELLC